MVECSSGDIRAARTCSEVKRIKDLEDYLPMVMAIRQGHSLVRLGKDMVVFSLPAEVSDTVLSSSVKAGGELNAVPPRYDI
jgi:hypothetical protein